MSVDPSHFLPVANGGKPPLLKLQNISARPELNGRFGQAVSFSAGRYVVAVLDATAAEQQPTFLKLKPENLTEAGNLDQLRVGAKMMYQTVVSYFSSPSMQEWGQNIIALLPVALQQKMTPNLAILAMAGTVQSIIILLLLLVGRMVGFTKLFVVITFIGLLMSVSSPDWIDGYRANKPIKLIAKKSALNFRRRWKDHLVAMTGYSNISDTMALVALSLLILFAGKILLTRAPQTHRIAMGDNVQNNHQASAIYPKYDLEYIYKLGYDDAKSGGEFGANFPKDIINNYAAEESLPIHYDQYDDEKNYDWVNTPSIPPHPRSKSPLGMGTMLSAFALYRFGKDVITAPNGQVIFDLQYVTTRLKSIEPWRLGMLVMAFYRVAKGLISFF